MDRSQHSRYLAYLKRYEYFGRGKPRLPAEEFLALEAELASLDPGDPQHRARRRELETVLLRGGG